MSKLYSYYLNSKISLYVDMSDKRMDCKDWSMSNKMNHKSDHIFLLNYLTNSLWCRYYIFKLNYNFSKEKHILHKYLHLNSSHLCSLSISFVQFQNNYHMWNHTLFHMFFNLMLMYMDSCNSSNLIMNYLYKFYKNYDTNRKSYLIDSWNILLDNLLNTSTKLYV